MSISCHCHACFYGMPPAAVAGGVAVVIDVIRASTMAAADAVSRPDLGRLAVGSAGDAAILTVGKGRFPYEDTIGETLIGDSRIEVRGVVLNGAWWHPAD